MNNPRLAVRYAKSLLDLATEKNQLEQVYNDIRYLQDICKTNPDFLALLNSPIISEQKKNTIIDAVTQNRLSPITASFIKLLGIKNRESNLPEVITAFVDQYYVVKKIHRAKLTTAVPLSDDLKNSFINKIKAENNIDNLDLETSVNDNIIGGFVLEMEGKLVDASVSRDLKDAHKQFQNNDYIHKLR